jgi:dienelactone hydrolase
MEDIMNRNRFFIILASLVFWGSVAQGAVITKTISYRQGGVDLQGFLAYDNLLKGKRPGVLIVHEWWGLNDYARKRAEQLASLGYVAFALDMYGKNKVTDHPKQAQEFMQQVTENIETWRQRALAGLNVLKQQPNTDPTRIAAIGYCFGGSTVQQLAYSGADIKGIVSFHGSLILPPASTVRPIKAKFLICHGAADPFTKLEMIPPYIAAMNASGIDWQMDIYGHAKHSFTNPGADKYGMPQLGYNRLADLRSWQAMKQFLSKIFSD